MGKNSLSVHDLLEHNLHIVEAKAILFKTEKNLFPA